MARIRTIKPEFFTSEDIVGLTPLARLLYIALWCEADKEGRMVWKPKTFKMRYLPGDDCSIDDLCAEILKAKLVALYSDAYAFIPAFKSHQHINPRESDSQLPEPDAKTTRAPRVSTRHSPDSDAQVGREGKGKEGTRVKPRETSLPENFGISERVKAWAVEKGHTRLQEHLENFLSYARRKGATYTDWDEALMEAIRKDWAKLKNAPAANDLDDIFRRGAA